MGPSQTTEQNAQLGVHVGDGAQGGAGVRAQPFLIYDDGGGQSIQQIHVGAVERGQESRVGLVDHPLRLGCDGLKHQ